MRTVLSLAAVLLAYFAKTKEGWSLYNSGYMPDLGSFLEY